MTRRAIVLALAGALALVTALGPAVARAEGAAEACAPERVDIRGPWGTARFSVEIADDDAERQRGLMFRDHLAAAHGMLFIYPRPGGYRFWMKNTLIPLDMIFIRPDGVVQAVRHEARPGDETPVGGGEGVLAVLEIRGGLARAIGIGPGDAVRHPAFGPGAAWPCGN
ncbi:MAG: DUF192 domain-containing protein [Alphaproteobacteria bacterium]|nr:MAG: DUF192 domain-containing protein [Alphaproteobacteria bacterium]